MRIEPLGDSAYIVRDLGDVPSYTAAEYCENAHIKGVVEIAPAYDTLGVYVEPGSFDLAELGTALAGVSKAKAVIGRTHEVPVCYALGEDLSSIADALGLSIEEVIDLHTSAEYTCFAVGFVPGFPYLGHLPERLRGLKRLPAPRVRVPNGAVAIVHDQTGIYPGGSPGGWRIIGMTPLTIVDLAHGFFAFKAGDRVRFSAVSLTEYESRKGERL